MMRLTTRAMMILPTKKADIASTATTTASFPACFTAVGERAGLQLTARRSREVDLLAITGVAEAAMQPQVEPPRRWGVMRLFLLRRVALLEP